MKFAWIGNVFGNFSQVLIAPVQKRLCLRVSGLPTACRLPFASAKSMKKRWAHHGWHLHIYIRVCHTYYPSSLLFSRVFMDWIWAGDPWVYMGCSDVSEFEHIYGHIFTTPSCVYDRLYTWTRMVDFNALIVWKTLIDICFSIKSSLWALTAAYTKFRRMIW